MAAVSLDEVEVAAGVGRSQIYHYFEDRDDLLRAATVNIVDAALERFKELMAERDNIASIERWFAATIALTEEHGGVGGCPIGSLVPQLAEHDDRVRETLRDAFARWQAPLIDGLSAMQHRGELRPDADVAELADITMAALQGGLLLAQVRRDVTPLRRALASARTAINATRTTRDSPQRSTGPSNALVGGG